VNARYGNSENVRIVFLKKRKLPSFDVTFMNNACKVKVVEFYKYYTKTI